jgi:hypothetical protein
MTLQGLDVSETVDNFQRFAIAIKNQHVDPLHAEVQCVWPDASRFRDKKPYPSAYRPGHFKPPKPTKKLASDHKEDMKIRTGSVTSESDSSSDIDTTGNTTSTSAAAQEDALFTSERAHAR